MDFRIIPSMSPAELYAQERAIKADPDSFDPSFTLLLTEALDRHETEQLPPTQRVLEIPPRS
ncbi:hypothetical protein SAMN04488590_0195 [Microbacterium sp. 77mftsu3.1]|nr:hypothetical protein SAMN04488590_0195 [Microbacterium sp. 77mftsu3.1]